MMTAAFVQTLNTGTLHGDNLTLYLLGIISTMITTVLCIRYYAMLAGVDISADTPNTVVSTFICGLMNGVTGCILIQALPMGWEIICVLFLASVEFYLLYRKSLRVDFTFHLCTYFASASNWVSAYMLLVAAMNLNGQHHASFGSLRYKLIVLTAAQLICAVLLMILRNSRLFPSRELGEALRTKGRRTMLLFNMISITVMGLITCENLVPILFGTHISRAFDNVLSMYFMLSVTVIVTGGYFMVFYISKYHFSSLESKSLATMLWREQCRRMASAPDEKSIVFEAAVNLSADEFVSGLEFFSPYLLAGGTKFSQVMGAFIKTCVHPDDAHLLTTYLSIEEIEKQQVEWTSHGARIRVSQKEIAKSMSGNQKFSIGRYAESWIWVEMNRMISVSKDTGDIYLYGNVINIHDQVKHNDDLSYGASHDSLTGLLNRSAFDRQMDVALEDFHEGIFFLFDLDRFKQINDVFGNSEGDMRLLDVTLMLQEVFHSEDLIARFDSDEFAVFSRKVAGKEDALAHAQDMLERAVKIYGANTAEECKASVSIGIAMAPTDGDCFQQLYFKADAALYRAKSQGGNQVCVYTPGVNEDFNPLHHGVDATLL